MWVDRGTCQYYSEMRLSQQFQACFFFFFIYEKVLSAQKALKRKPSGFHPLKSLCA